MTTTFIYRSIDKMEKQPDGTLMVEGIATDAWTAVQVEARRTMATAA